jgi:hypothetical protein
VKKLLFVMLVLLFVVPATSSYSATINNAWLWSENAHYEDLNLSYYGMVADTEVSTNAYDVFMYIPSLTGNEYLKLDPYTLFGSPRAAKFISDANGYPAPGSVYENIDIFFFIDENGNGMFDSSEPNLKRNFPSGTFQQVSLVKDVKVTCVGSDVTVSWNGIPLGGRGGLNDHYRVRIMDKEARWRGVLFEDIVDINTSDKYTYNFGDVSEYGESENLYIAIEAREGVEGIDLANRSRYYASCSPPPVSHRSKAIPGIPLLLLDD